MFNNRVLAGVMWWINLVKSFTIFINPTESEDHLVRHGRLIVDKKLIISLLYFLPYFGNHPKMDWLVKGSRAILQQPFSDICHTWNMISYFASSQAQHSVWMTLSCSSSLFSSHSVTLSRPSASLQILLERVKKVFEKRVKWRVLRALTHTQEQQLERQHSQLQWQERATWPVSLACHSGHLSLSLCSDSGQKIWKLSLVVCFIIQMGLQ